MSAVADAKALNAIYRDAPRVSLRDLLLESQNGLSKRRGDEGEPVSVLRLADVVGGVIDEANPRAINLTKKEIEKYALQRGDLVCIRVNGSRNLVGRVVPFASSRVWAYCDHFIRMRARHDVVDHRYLAHYLNSREVRRYVELNMVSSAGQNTVSQGTMLEMAVPLPDLAKQREIVAEIEKQFSRIDEAVADLKRVKTGLMRYKAAVLKAAVDGRLGSAGAEFSLDERTASWQQIGLAISSLSQGWSPQCEREASENDDEWAVMKTTAVQPMMFLATENKRLPRGLVPRDHLELILGDLLITRAGPRSRVGVSCLVKATRPHLMLCDKAYRMRPKLEVAAPEYLEIVLNSPTILDSLDDLKTGISDSGLNLTQKRFLELLVPLPSLVEQARIVSDVDRRLSLVRKVEAELDSNMKRAHVLRSATLARYFSSQGKE